MSLINIDLKLLAKSSDETKKAVALKLTEFVKAMTLDTWRFITANSLVVGIEYGSPVLSGQYYTNHRIAVNTTDITVNYLPDPNPESPVSGLPLSGAQLVLVNYKLGDSIVISNSLPYAQRLENGWSQLKAPAGVYKVAADRVRVKYGKGLVL